MCIQYSLRAGGGGGVGLNALISYINMYMHVYNYEKIS